MIEFLQRAAAILLVNGDGIFGSPSVIGTLGNPMGLVAGDFNKDGKLDVAFQSATSPAVVSVYLGNGAGAFTFSANYTVGNWCCGVAQSLAAADLRHNGKLDLVALNNSDLTLSVLLGNGDGTFQNPVTYTVTNGPNVNPSGVAVGDFNGDGKPDLVVPGDDGGGTVSILPGNGNGTFQAPVVYSYNSQFRSPGGVAVADLNGDHHLDVALATIQGATVLLGNGDGTFQSPVNYTVPQGYWLYAGWIGVADLNHDHKLDLVLSGSPGTSCCAPNDATVSVFLGNGDGTFQHPQGYATDEVPKTVLLADSNRDGNLDFAVANASPGTITAALGNGDGTFQAGPNFGFLTNNTVDGFVSADFNNDGNLDIAVAKRDGTINVYTGNTHGTFPASPIVTTIGSNAFVLGYNPGNGSFAASGMQAADMDGDGKLDLVAAVSLGGATPTNLAVMLGNGNGTFGPAALYPVGDTSGILAVVVADFNRDGKPDVAVTNADGNAVSVLLNQGNGVLGAPALVAGSLNTSILTVADLNGDGKVDIVVPGCPGTVFLGNGDGTFGPPIAMPGSVCAFVAVVADFNGDGKPDLAVGSTGNGGYVAILLGNGDGTFQPPANVYNLSCGAGDFPNPFNLAAADLNLDGKLDLIVGLDNTERGAGGLPWYVCSGNNGVLVFSGNGDGTLQPPTGSPFLVGPHTGGVLVGDFNKDGMPDLAVYNATGGSSDTFFTVLLNRTLAVSLSPDSLNYSTQLVGTSSKAQTVVLTNDTSSPLSLASLAVTGADSADFKLTNHCPSSLKAGLTCGFSVAFDPAAGGARTAAVTGAGSATVSLSGIATQVKLSPAKLNFGSVTVGQSSTPQTVTVTNVGSSTLSFTGTRIKVVGADAGDFLETNNCGASLGAGLSCTIKVTFKPTATGTRGADVRLTDNGGASPQYVPLSGTGT